MTTEQITQALTSMRYKGIEFETNEKDILLLAFLVRDLKWLQIEKVYGKEFTNEFYKAVYPEQLFI